MSRSYPTRIDLSLALADQGSFTAAQALSWANVTIDEGAEYEIDHKLLHEENEDFDCEIVTENRLERVDFVRTGDAEGKLAVTIYIHY
jgi:hypothetical protein